MSLPAAFLFDMDGLLLDSERLMMSIFLGMTDQHGIDRERSTDFFLDLIGTSSAETTRRLGWFLPEHLSVAQFDAAFRDLYQARSAQGIALRPHVQDVLAHLQGLGARMAVVTSTHGAPARHKLAAAGLLDYFDHIRAGDDVRANKPDPAPYLQAADALGVAASDCAAFEDSDPGITAAVAAGCLAFQIPDLRPKSKPLPDLGQRVATDLKDALTQLDLW